MIDKATENSRVRDLQKLGYEINKTPIPYRYENKCSDVGTVYIRPIEGSKELFMVALSDIKSESDILWQKRLNEISIGIDEEEKELVKDLKYKVGQERLKKKIIDELTKASK